MNLTEMFSPSTFLSKELQESADWGLSRIEISYHANDTVAERKFFEPSFEVYAKYDILMVNCCLNRYKKLVCKVSLKELL